MSSDKHVAAKIPCGRKPDPDGIRLGRQLESICTYAKISVVLTRKILRLCKNQVVAPTYIEHVIERMQ